MKLISATIFSLFLATSASAGSEQVKDCTLLANEVVKPLTEQRDYGMTPQQAIQLMVMAGAHPEIAVLIAQYVYIIHKESTPEATAEEFFKDCVGQGV
jgi:hypothetical protein